MMGIKARIEEGGREEEPDERGRIEIVGYFVRMLR